MGLLTDSTRTATVRASGRVHALRLDRDTFTEMVRWHPAVRAQFERLSDYRTIQDFLRLHSAFATLPVDGLALIAASLEPVDVEAGEVVVREGDPPGPMYVIEEGRLRAFLERDGQRDDINYLRKGDSFGELSVFEGRPRTASVEALTPGRLLRLTPELFAKLLDEYPEFRKRLEERAVQLDSLPVARVPLDFAEILPAETEVRPGRPRPGRGDRGRARRSRGRGGVRGEGLRPEAPLVAAPASPAARLPARRDGLWRRLPRRGHALLRPARLAAADPRARAHVGRRDEPARDRARRRGARARRADGSRLEEQPRRAAAAGDRPLGGKPLGRALRGGREPRSGRRPVARHPQDRSRRVRGEVERLCGAVQPDARVRGAAEGADEHGLAEAVPPPAPRAAAEGRRPGADRGRARAGRRRSSPRSSSTTRFRTRTRSCSS